VANRLGVIYNNTRLIFVRLLLIIDVFVYAAKELIEELLKTDPDKRLTIHQVMKHNWIAVKTNSLSTAFTQLL